MAPPTTIASTAPAGRACTACGRPKAADQSLGGRGPCRACRAERARARDRALRRLAAERLDAFRQAHKRRLRTVPATPVARARKRATAQALSDLGKRFPERYRALYEQELDGARAEPLPVRRGRRPSSPDRLSLTAASLGSTWWRAGPRPRRPGRDTEGARRRAELQAVRRRAAALFAKGVPASEVAHRLGVARQTAVRWQASWRAGGAAALRSREPSQRPAVPDSKLPVIDKALRQGAAAHGFDGDVWTVARIGVVVQRLTGVQLARSALQDLLHRRLGWTVQRP